jgi:hypothetical protein
MDQQELQASLAAKSRWATRLSHAADHNGNVDREAVRARHVVREQQRAERLASDGLDAEQRRRAEFEVGVEDAVARGELKRVQS